MVQPVTSPSKGDIDSQLSTLQYCAAGIGDVDTYLPGVDVIPQVNSGDQYQDVTDIGQTQRVYGRKALPEDQDFELAFRHQPGKPDQKAFCDLVKNRESISIKVTRASGEVQDFLFLPQDHYSGESGKEGLQMFGCIGKIQLVKFTTLEEV